MAEDLNRGKEILFADGVNRLVKPLTIRQLRKFIKIIQNFDTNESNTLTEEQIDQMVDAVAIALEKVDSDLAADRELLEEALDMKSMNEVIAVAMGSDPNA